MSVDDKMTPNVGDLVLIHEPLDPYTTTSQTLLANGNNFGVVIKLRYTLITPGTSSFYVYLVPSRQLIALWDDEFDVIIKNFELLIGDNE